MSGGIINPHTGMPMSPPRQLSDEQIVQIVQALQMKIHLLNQQNMQLGLYVEFVVENLTRMTDANGDQVFVIDLEEWPEWAEARYKQIQEEHQQQAASELAEEARQTISGMTESAQDLGIDLDDGGSRADG
jgi:hypothetical protein